MQAYIAAIHLPVEYVRYNQVAGDQFFRWTDRVHMDLGGTAKSFTEKQIRTALAPQDQRGMQFPESCLLWSWNQMSVESGFTKDCVTKRKAADVWEDELNRVSKPLALYNGHDLFPPNPGRHLFVRKSHIRESAIRSRTTRSTTPFAGRQRGSLG